MVSPVGVGAWIVRANGFDVEREGAAVAVKGANAVTVMLKLKVPAVLGVPLRVPVVVSRLSPGGGESMDQLRL
jgi:hypothetical protein